MNNFDIIVLDNAVKYSREGGLIVFDFLIKEDRIVLSISDEGIGISPEKLGSIFELKKGKSEMGTAGEKGTGIGQVE